MKRRLEIVIDSGETTRSRERGVSCDWVRTRRLGTVRFCGLFDGKELEGDEWLQRLPECVEAEKRGT